MKLNNVRYIVMLLLKPNGVKHVLVVVLKKLFVAESLFTVLSTVTNSIPHAPGGRCCAKNMLGQTSASNATPQSALSNSP